MKNNEKQYEFRGKIFKCSEKTIVQLNYALALNGSDDRYVEIKNYEKTK
jgi:hypothetical protein